MEKRGWIRTKFRILCISGLRKRVCQGRETCTWPLRGKQRPTDGSWREANFHMLYGRFYFSKNQAWRDYELLWWIPETRGQTQLFLTPKAICRNTELGWKGVKLWGFPGDIDSWIWLTATELEWVANKGQQLAGWVSLFPSFSGSWPGTWLQPRVTRWRRQEELLLWILPLTVTKGLRKA